jgi:hypothetical protein
MAVDGATNGTRKLSAAAPAFLTSVTTPSLTSPAGIDLTLGLGTGGTALTLTNSTRAATFAGVVVVTDGSAAAPSLVVSSSATTGFYRYGAGAIGFSSAGLASAAFSSNSGGGGLYLEALGTNQNIRVVPSGTGVFTTASPVTFTNATAGSAGAGALVVTGGLATGGVSYFGGNVQIKPVGASATATPFALSLGGEYFNNATPTAAAVKLRVYDDGAGGYNGLGNDNAGLFSWSVGTSNFWVNNGTLALTLATTKAATFAGAVSITGNIGFYGQAATAKPTGVAVTAAAIHAALVTLNLIAA